jgi:putative selenium metabolism hydrolase
MDIEQFSENISAWMQSNKSSLVHFLQEFVSVKSVTYEEGPAVKWYAEKLKEFGFDEVRIDAVGNCLGRVGNGKTVLLFDAHIDTVEPGKADDWGMDPLKASYVDGIVRGRGAVDDKACLTGFAFAGKALKELGIGGDYTMWVSASISEEDVEGSCVKAMMEVNPDIKPDYIIVGEASEMRLIRGHKGRALIKVVVTGKAAHASAAWRGENALIKALPLIKGVDEMKEFTADPFLGRGSIEVTKVECDTPSLNTIPGRATVFIDRRISCGESVEDLLKELQPLVEQVKGKASIDIEKVSTYTGFDIEQEDYFPSWVIPEDHVLVLTGVKAFRTLFNREPVIGAWDFCTNATHLCGRTGIPAIGLGPGDGSLCHSTQDGVRDDELVEAAAFYAIFPPAMAGK